MKERMLEFLFKRISSKLDDLRAVDGRATGDDDFYYNMIEDIDAYMGELKDIVTELMV